MTFTDVTIDKEANMYFDGLVTSRKITFADGSYKTLGIMLPGEYEFATTAREEMDITAGKLQYKLQHDEWQTIDGQGIFYVPAHTTFQLKVERVTDYCCTYLQDE